jgi:hypothetical protein
VIAKDAMKGSLWQNEDMVNEAIPILIECKAVLSLKTLESERVGYRIWAEKLKNIINHVRPGAKWLLEMAETKMMPESEEAIIRVMEASECPKGAWKEFGEDLSFLLLEKTEGEARE